MIMIFTIMIMINDDNNDNDDSDDNDDNNTNYMYIEMTNLDVPQW